MSIEELVPLTNGLSVPCGPAMFVCDRARVTRSNGEIDLKFLIAGTDFVPRVTLRKDLITAKSSADVARILRRVARHALGAGCAVY